MMRRAVAAAGDGLRVLGVTILTSLEDAQLERIGIAGPVQHAVLRLAEVALEAGAHGLVCSPLEVASIRRRFGPAHEGGPILVVPGIRARGQDHEDQRRTSTAREAVERGADLIVVGRPITAAPDPRAAAARIARELELT